MVVPEERHLLAEWSLGGEHPFEPPFLGLEAAQAVFLLEFFDELAFHFLRIWRREFAHRLAHDVPLLSVIAPIRLHPFGVGPRQDGK